ncbi:RNA polymerase II-associated protein 3 [Eumeta japonica]|uniref:RNA polymerase II-associated protein 3 n=1 Tax=Eumeta variegata TaxID=151549 RepID=A0A4C1WJG1_EUMVA|nr:RNA polymerase II-associated protein 3 [Eumeta japonica]
MEKAYAIQKQVRDDVNSLQSYMSDLQNWESEMKRKEAALNGQFEQDLPPVRSKIKKGKPVAPITKRDKRISSADYQAWDKFDADKACEDIDMEDVGPSSLDGKNSQGVKSEKLREEAQYEKEKGNNFVKQEKWDDAISCYNRAIELIKDDAIYYANRALCHLKKESLHLAEADCSQALKLDPTYVKALQRRAAAREKLGSLRGASADLTEVLKLEPKNTAAAKQLQAIKARMGTKGTKSKSSPVSTPTSEAKNEHPRPKIIELEDPNPAKEKPITHKPSSPLENWKNGVGEDITVIVPVKKPPHLRSKKALKPIQIKEIPLGQVEPTKPPTRMKIVTCDRGTEKTDESIIIDDNGKFGNKGDFEYDASLKLNGANSPESQKLEKDLITKENNDIKDLAKNGIGDVLKQTDAIDFSPPMSSIQFMIEWKNMKGKPEARSDYLQLIDPDKIPSIFHNALESAVLSDVLQILNDYRMKFAEKKVSAYLKGICNVKRFPALAMFMSNEDKKFLNNLLAHCKSVEGCTEEEIADLKNKFEL